MVSNAEEANGPGHGGLDGEGREVALVDPEWESPEDEEVSVDESDEDEGLRSWERREWVVLVFVIGSAEGMRRVVGCIKEGGGSISIGRSWSGGVMWMSGSSSEKTSESVSYSLSSETGAGGGSRSSSQRTQTRPL